MVFLAMLARSTPAQRKSARSFKLTASAFEDRGRIPRRFTCDGANVSPALAWSGEPEGTQSFALIVDDSDAPAGFNHWLVWDIPASAHSLDGGSADGISGANDFGSRGYGGPCPPQGTRRYAFHLFALNTPSLRLAAGARRSALDKALRSHVIAKVEYDGDYGR